MSWIICRLERLGSLQWGGWVYGCVLPSGVFMNEYITMIYYFSDLIVECFCLVYVGGLEFVFINEILYFGFVLLDYPVFYTYAFNIAKGDLSVSSTQLYVPFVGTSLKKAHWHELKHVT
jgi:hypothetical protein